MRFNVHLLSEFGVYERHSLPTHRRPAETAFALQIYLAKSMYPRRGSVLTSFTRS